MHRKRSIPDRASAGTGRLVPYRCVEDFRTRHVRRLLNANLEHEAEVRHWCEQNGLKLRITNEGHHWQIFNGGFLAQWWPSSAKLVIGKRCRDEIHCQDYKQVLKRIGDFPKSSEADDAAR